jgi:hypothetical protein
MSTATFEVQKSIYGVLTTDTPLWDLGVTGIYDDVPDNARYPYVAIGQVTETDKPNTQLTVGRELTLTFHIWSRAKGFYECDQIAGRIITILEDEELIGMPSWDWTMTYYEMYQTMRDPDGLTRHGILRFRVRVSRAA